MILPSSLITVSLLAFAGAECQFAGKPLPAPQSASVLDALIRQAPLPIDNNDSAQRKKQKHWYNYRLLSLQRIQIFRCLDERLRYDFARKMLDAEMQLADGPFAVIRVAVKRWRLEAESP